MNDIESNDRPKWLLELENRKRKPRLAHEAGAGAPCMICATTCPGLDLHFWRKICKNCKCNKDDHDVDDEDFPQFDLLFGASRKYKKKPILLYINNEKGYAEEAFEWVPPDTTKELATDYMKALPVEKLPIKGSVGAALRRQLLQKQLPLHDIDHKVCDELSEEEKNEFEKYLEDIKKYVGQGTVTKILSARPFDRSLVTPANATDMQHFRPQNSNSSMNAQSSMVQLRTPSSFTPKNSYKRDPCESLKKHERSLQAQNNCNRIKNIPTTEKDNSTGNSGYTVKAESTESEVYNKADHPTSFSKTNNSHDIANKEVLTTDNSTPAFSSNSSKDYTEAWKDKLENPSAARSFSYLKPTNNDTFVPENILLANTAFPSSTVQQANDIIGSTLDKKGLMFIREKLTTKYSKQEKQGQVPYSAPSFARDFNSSNLLSIDECIASQNDNVVNDTKKTVAATMKPEKNIVESIPAKAEKEIIKAISQVTQSTALNSMPFDKTAGKERLQENTLLTPTSETPNNLLSKCSYNSFLTPATIIYSEKLENQIFPYGTIDIPKQSVRNLQNMEQLKTVMEEQLTAKDPADSQKCQKCEEEIRVGDVAVITEKMKNVSWHPGCFVCSTCNELLVDLVYFYYKNKLYCGRDLAMLLGIPRCFACDELIFLREYTVAEGHNYHVKHFCCWDCDIPLAGKQYITENDRPLCLPCYQKTYAKTCNTCENIIAADQQGVAVKDLNFHATESCFCCYICTKNLLQGKIAVKEKKLFCSKECISKFLHS